MRTCFSTCRSVRPSIFASLPRKASASARSVSRSSPKNLMTICAAHARQHVIEAVRDRLADIERDRQHGEARADVGDNDILAAAALLQVDFDFRGVDAFGMLIEFGAAGAPAHSLDLRHLQHKLLGNQADAVRFGERDAGVEQHVDGEGALVEGRQERARQQRGAGRDHGDHSKRQQQFLPVKGALQQRPVGRA